MPRKTVSSFFVGAMATAGRCSRSLRAVSFDDNSVWFHESDSACLTSVTII
jgi:hypothetical protein